MTKVPLSILFLWLLTTLSVLSCNPVEEQSSGPYFGNGLHNGWADQTSIVLWTRLTKNPEGNRNGAEFIGISAEQHRQMRKSTNRDSLHAAQIPEGLRLEDMVGACPGAPGEVQLTYYPEEQADQAQTRDWAAVNVDQNFTLQWQLQGLRPNTKYTVQLLARGLGQETVSDTLQGSFLTPPASTTEEDVRFVVVTCHDYIRRDDLENGHKIYPAMQALHPDFYFHAGDIEYYDKPDPFALTEELMRFKWDRLFALPFQRTFFNQHTTYFMKDDHDVLADDAYPGMTYGTVSYERGLEIFDKEQFPSNPQLYKTVRWGKDLQIWIVEGRNFRSKNNAPDGPDKTIWGEEQKAWFFKTVEASDATFKVLFTSTPILGPDRNNKKDNYSNNNFQYESKEIRDFLNQQENFFICNGDRHWQYVSHPEGTNLWEFSVGAGADAHAGGWNPEDKRPEHRFLRVKGGFLSGYVFQEDGKPTIRFQHHDVDGNVVHEEAFQVD